MCNIERRRQESLNTKTSFKNTNHKQTNRYSINIASKFGFDGFDVDVSSRNNNSTTGFIYNKALSQHFDTIEEAKLYASEIASRDKEYITEINAQYDAELATLDKPRTDTAAASKGAGSTGTIFDMKANKKIIVGKPSKIKEYEYEAGSPDQEVEWIKSILGNEIAIEVYDHALTMDNGVKAMGAMIGDSILLLEGAEKGTGFHEAFHCVS